jgi:Uma2 family endonuclease
MTPLMTTAPRIPVLRTGDRLTRDEFERRYSAMPDVKKAELLEGVVYMPSPVRCTQHGEPHALLASWLSEYERATPGVAFLIDTTLRLDVDNEPQPDLLLRVLGARARSRIDAEGYLQGPPELAIEVAASSVSYDLHQKLHVYRRSGVQEYLVLRAEDAEADWFALHGGHYERLPADAAGVRRSEVFPGLWLDVPALLRRDPTALRQAIAAGTTTAAHAGFVALLAR